MIEPLHATRIKHKDTHTVKAIKLSNVCWFIFHLEVLLKQIRRFVSKRPPEKFLRALSRESFIEI